MKPTGAPDFAATLARVQELELTAGGEAVQAFLEDEVLPCFADPEEGERWCQALWEALHHPGGGLSLA